MSDAMTRGIDHVGLTASDLDATVAFFTEGLGWNVVGGRPEYPSVFISDGSAVLTLWQAKVDNPVAFDRRANVGLHHLALKFASREALDTAFERVRTMPGVEVEFATEPSRGGPKVHAMVYEPSGNRIELAFMPG